MKPREAFIEGGGWGGVETRRIKLKARIALGLAVVVGGSAVMFNPDELHVWALAGVLLICAIVLFIVERPVEYVAFMRWGRPDPRKLYVSEQEEER